MDEHIVMLCKDAFALNSRLFDHRAIIRAECKYIVRELELKKSRESSKMILEIILSADKTKCRINECTELLSERLSRLHMLVVSATTSALDILNNHNKSEDHEIILREEYKNKREKELGEFMEEMNKAKLEIIQKHEASMDKLDGSPVVEEER